MVKFGKNKIKLLNKLAKKPNDSSSNKVIRKKLNAEKKVSFQKEVLLKQAFKSDALVKKVRTTAVPQGKSKDPQQVKPKPEVKTKKIKAVEKQKKRQKTQINDTKLLLSLMNKK